MEKLYIKNFKKGFPYCFTLAIKLLCCYVPALYIKLQVSLNYGIMQLK